MDGAVLDVRAGGPRRPARDDAVLGVGRPAPGRDPGEQGVDAADPAGDPVPGVHDALPLRDAAAYMPASGRAGGVPQRGGRGAVPGVPDGVDPDGGDDGAGAAGAGGGGGRVVRAVGAAGRGRCAAGRWGVGPVFGADGGGHGQQAHAVDGGVHLVAAGVPGPGGGWIGGVGAIGCPLAVHHLDCPFPVTIDRG